MSTWRPIMPWEIYTEYSMAHQGDGVYHMESEWGDGLYANFNVGYDEDGVPPEPEDVTWLPIIRVTMLSYEEVFDQSFPVGTRFVPPRVASGNIKGVGLDKANEVWGPVQSGSSGEYDEDFGYLTEEKGPVIAGWEPGEMVFDGPEVLWDSFRISASSMTADRITPVHLNMTFKLEVMDTASGGGGDVECFWTDLTRVTQVCGNTPPPPASISVIGADMYGNQNPGTDSMEWEAGNMPAFPEGDYTPAEAINVLANITGSPQDVPDYCGTLNSAGIVGDKIVVLNQTLGCGSYYYDRSSIITGNWKSLLPPESNMQNPGQRAVVAGSIFAVGTVSTGGQLTGSAVFIALLPDANASLSLGAKVQFNPPPQSTITVSEADKAYGIGSFEEMMDAGEMCVTVAANGYNWAGGAGNFSVDCQLFIRPPVYSVSAGIVTDMEFYRGATIAVGNNGMITVEGAGDLVPGTFSGVTMNVYEDAYQEPDGTTQRYGHNFVLPNNGVWSDYSQDEGVAVGDLYLADSDGGPHTFVGRVAFRVSSGGGGEY